MVNRIREWFRSMFVREVVVTVPVTVEKIVEKRVVEPIRREYWVLASHTNAIVQRGEVTGETEFNCLLSVYALHGERVQFSNGGRYRCHADGNGWRVFTRIDRAKRDREGARQEHRDRRLSRDEGGIVGE